MNFIFDSCFFQKNSPFNQSGTALLPQNRIPFTDVTQQMNSFYNTKKNQQINIFPKYFNDFSNDKENFTFLKKKSFGEKINNTEKDEEYTGHNNTLNMQKKFPNNCYKMQRPLINSLNEDDDEEEDKENFYQNNYENNRKRKKNQCLSFNQILNDAINEKREFDKNEREKKKVNKLKHLKMLLKNKKSAIYNNDTNYEMANKENIYNNVQINYVFGFQEEKKEKELNMMNLD